MGFWTDDDGWELFMIANDRHVRRLRDFISLILESSESLTPFISGTIESGSVAMLASSRKTMGKSMY